MFTLKGFVHSFIYSCLHWRMLIWAHNPVPGALYIDTESALVECVCWGMTTTVRWLNMTTASHTFYLLSVEVRTFKICSLSHCLGHRTALSTAAAVLCVRSTEQFLLEPEACPLGPTVTRPLPWDLLFEKYSVVMRGSPGFFLWD